MFALDHFVSDCRTALKQDASHKLVREVVARAVSDPAAVLKALGEPMRAEMQVLHRSGDLTVLNMIWRRVPGSPEGKVEAAGARALSAKDAEPLGRDIIHSVTNPIPRLTGAIHVYGGDFFGVPRSEWDSESLREQPCDGAKMARRFEDANALLVRS